ncbi:MAG: glucose-6-phosphate isomerase [Thermodesulfovibrionales bacterium]|nr:glucose-6-phosphate isomerase [Thermodesulfovibrionales bacterium]
MITLNIANMMSGVMGQKGISEKSVEGIKDRVLAAHEEITQRKRSGLGFMDLIKQDTKDIKKAAEAVRGKYDNFILLGIGGSALGPKCIIEALSPMHNLKKSPKVFIYENVDPMTLNNILSVLDLKKTAVNVITKSGTTAETMASFMILYERLKGSPENFIATTDPEKGNLRKLATELGFKTLPIPPDVGGRYSVLSPVGLLPAEIIGADSDELLRGAGDMQKRCSGPDVWKNPAYLMGALLYLMDKEKGRKTDVLVPYSDRLKVMAEWFCQLWAESLGKQGLGLTPFPSLGTTDQHSQLQLWMEGPEDKVIVFIKVDDHGADIKIPEVFKESGTGYLGGHSLAELINAEEESTELCLQRAGRPNMTIGVPSIDAYHLGQLFFFFEIATAFTGFLYGINPFDQPSVEEGKNFTYGMMGRKGYEEKRAEVQEARKKKAGWKV